MIEGGAWSDGGWPLDTIWCGTRGCPAPSGGLARSLSPALSPDLPHGHNPPVPATAEGERRTSSSMPTSG
jgi:hypothetical protein